MSDLTVSAPQHTQPSRSWRVWLGFGSALLLLAVLIELTVPFGGAKLLLKTLFDYDSANYQHIVVGLTYLPRLTVALLCGFALSVAGCVMQFVLRNPIAAPTTLGVASGAQFGLIASMLLVPGLAMLPAVTFAFIGGVFSTVLVFWLSARKGFAAVQMVLSGMVVSLFLGSVNTMLMLLNEKQLTNIFVWGTGSLNQNGWDGVWHLAPVIAATTALLLLVQRPLSSLALGDTVADSIGVNVKRYKIISLGLAILLTAVVVSEVGLIGFVGIVTPNIVRLLKVRALSARILWSGLLGSMMLLLSDLLIQAIPKEVTSQLLPTGAMTALIGAPFFLWLLTRNIWPSQHAQTSEAVVHYKHTSFARQLFWLGSGLVVVMVVAATLGHQHSGWLFSVSPDVLALRAPRLLSALLAGIGLAVAGTLIQRMTTNPMASPEVLGISSGASLAMVLCVMFGIKLGRDGQILVGTLGALAVAAVIWATSRKQHFAPMTVILTGIALSAALDALLRITLSSSSEDAQSLLTWLSGSTYLTSWRDVVMLVCGITPLLMLALKTSRHVNVVSLGQVSASSLGMHVGRVRQGILLMVAALTTLCTIVIGPLTFIGLLAPHMARAMGRYDARSQLISACLIGAIVMTLSDWVGRMVWFPWQFPAGLISSMLGGVYFLYLMRKN